MKASRLPWKCMTTRPAGPTCLKSRISSMSTSISLYWLQVLKMKTITRNGIDPDGYMFLQFLVTNHMLFMPGSVWWNPKYAFWLGTWKGTITYSLHISTESHSRQLMNRMFLPRNWFGSFWHLYLLIFSRSRYVTRWFLGLSFMKELTNTNINLTHDIQVRYNSETVWISRTLT